MFNFLICVVRRVRIDWNCQSTKNKN